MKAAVLKEKGVISVEEVPIPEFSESSMLIRVEACGLCGSDLRIFSKGDSRAKYPVILGHEIAGVVEKKGSQLNGFKEGDRVCVAPGHGCGECKMCQRGFLNLCVSPFPSVGYAYDGGFAQYFVPPVNVVQNGFINKIPDHVTFDQASYSELLACCLNGQRNTPVAPGDYVVIFGAGPAGCTHLQLARKKGAKKVFLVDIAEDRLAFASKFSPDLCILATKEDVMSVILQETEGWGADAVFVCAPSKEAQQLGIHILAPRGKINFFGGLSKHDCNIELDSNLVHYKELTLSGSSSSLPKDNKEALEWISEKRVNPDDVISHILPLDKIHDAFASMQDRTCTKIIIKPWA